MRRFSSLGIAAALLLCSQMASAELLGNVRATTPTFVVRQGARIVTVLASHATCEAEAQRLTPNPIAARRTFQLRSGSGTVLATSTNPEECLAAPVARLTAEGSWRPVPPKLREGNVNTCVMTTSFSASFQPPICVASHNFIATYVASTAPPATCTVQPSTESRTCPAGTTGTWSQTSTVSAYPACVVTWTPATPASDRCPPIQQPTGPTLTLSVVNTLDVHLAWTSAGTSAYSVENCRGAGCTNFEPLACTQSTRYVQSLPAQSTARYRVRGSGELNCSGSFRAYSAAQQVTVGGAVSPGEAFLSWTPPSTNSDGTPISNFAGYYIVYGRTEAGMDRQIIINNPSISRYTVSGLSAGTWYFALKSFTTNFAIISNLSNIRSKTVQ